MSKDKNRNLETDTETQMKAYTAKRVDQLLRGSEMANEDTARIHRLCSLIFRIAKKHLKLPTDDKKLREVGKVSLGNKEIICVGVYEGGYKIFHILDKNEDAEQCCAAHIYTKNDPLPAALLKRLKPEIGSLLRDVVNTVPESDEEFESLIEYAKTA